MQPSRTTRTSKRNDGDERSGAVVPYGQNSTQQTSRRAPAEQTTSGRPSRMQVALPGHHYERQPTAYATERSSQMQVALPSREHGEPSRSKPGQFKYSAPDSQMQVALPGRKDSELSRADRPAQSKYSASPSQMQVALPGREPSRADGPAQSRYSAPASQMQVAPPGGVKSEPSRSDESAQSRYSAPSSQMQVALPDHARRIQVQVIVREIRIVHHDLPTERSDFPSRFEPSIQEDRTIRYPEPSYTSRYEQTLLSIPDAEPSRRPTRDPTMPTIREPEPSKRTTHAPKMSTIRDSEPSRSIRFEHENTREVALPQGQPTRLVRPGEPHHFGSRTDHQRGEVMCTTCRCSDPDSHSDAYTMLNSPRGYDINNKPIDWQEAKNRMLDFYGKCQISHQEEMEAIPHVFSAETAAIALRHEEELRKAARKGQDIHVNVNGNNVNWFTERGRAKPYITSEGVKTQVYGGGGS
jgi:hypothetical protein